MVSRIGNWGQSSPGTITFRVTVPDAGEYALTMHYVNTSETREAEIVVNGAAPLSPWPTFPNTSDPPTCIDARAPITITLQQGSNTIRIGNPSEPGPDDRQDRRQPALRPERCTGPAVLVGGRG